MGRKKLIRDLNYIKARCIVNENNCWVWRLACSQTGGAQASVNGKSVLVVRFLMRLLGHDLSDKSQFVCHHCDVRNCCNPDHLYIGNAKTNYDDMVKRNRWNNGHINKRACKLGHELVGANVRILKKKNGKVQRICRVCHRTRNRKSKNKRYWERKEVFGGINQQSS